MARGRVALTLLLLVAVAALSDVHAAPSKGSTDKTKSSKPNSKSTPPPPPPSGSPASGDLLSRFWNFMDPILHSTLVYVARGGRILREQTEDIRQTQVYKEFHSATSAYSDALYTALRTHVGLGEDHALLASVGLMSGAIALAILFTVYDVLSALCKLPSLRLRSPLDTLRLVGSAVLFAEFTVLTLLAHQGGNSALNKLVAGSPYLVWATIVVSCSNFLFHSLSFLYTPFNRLNFWNVTLVILALGGLAIKHVPSRSLLESIAITVLTSATAVRYAAVVYAVQTALTIINLSFLFLPSSPTSRYTAASGRTGGSGKGRKVKSNKTIRVG